MANNNLFFFCTSGFPCVSDSDRRVPAELGQESQLEHLKHKVLFLIAFWQGYFVCLYFKIVWILYHLCGLSGKVSTYQCRRCEFDP